MLDNYYATETAIISRIQSQVPQIKTVTGIHQEVKADSATGPLPAVVVACGGHEPKNHAGPHALVAQRWEVTVVVSAPNDRSGAKARTEAGPLIIAAIRALAGWSPVTGCSGMALEAGGWEEYTENMALFGFAMTTNISI
ncbi:MAG: DUF1834 family protein [Nitrospinota bacterium]|nr:DUF1834 family protein [Nitrospinota bacterium]